MFCLLTDCDAVNRFVAMYWEINFLLVIQLKETILHSHIFSQSLLSMCIMQVQMFLFFWTRFYSQRYFLCGVKLLDIDILEIQLH